jgi:signal transduction histidine kinase
VASGEKKKAKARMCFVVGPIGAPGSDTRIAADWLLNAVIKPVLKELEFLVRRSDEIPEPGMIDSQVINNVLDADLVIADLSEKNPNAFYELAIRHMIERPIIHMVDAQTEIPFDVRPFRAIQFDLKTFRGVEVAKEDLRTQSLRATSPDHRVENPITRARGNLELRQSASPKEKLVLDTLDDLSGRLERLEKRSSRSAESSTFLQSFSKHRELPVGDVEVEIVSEPKISLTQIRRLALEVAAVSNVALLQVFVDDIGTKKRMRFHISARAAESVTTFVQNLLEQSELNASSASTTILHK